MGKHNKTIDVIKTVLKRELGDLCLSQTDTDELADTLWLELLRHSDVIKMQEISDENGSIIACPDFVGANLDSKRAGGTITMGVSNPFFADFLLKDKYLPALYLVNREEYLKLRDRVNG